MNLIKELRNAVIVGISIYVVFLIIYFFQGGKDHLTAVVDIEDFIIHMIYSIVLYTANTAVFLYLFGYHKHKRFTAKHVFQGIFSGIIVSVVSIFLLNLAHTKYITGFTWVESFNHQKLMDVVTSLIISMVVTGIFYAVYYYRYKKETQVKEQKIIAGTASAQFDALKNQLDPHFLFNSLNVLVSLIEENPDQAQKFTTSLSKVYRYVLEQKNKELVTVAEELAFAKTYMSLIKMRYEDSIVFTMPENPINPDAKVVPLSLQLLLENAVKHNRVTPSSKLHITIIQRDGYLSVQNNLQEKAVMARSSGVGLLNIQRRYYLLTTKEVQIQKTPATFEVSIPTLTKQLSPLRTSSKDYIEDKKYARAKERVEALKGFYVHAFTYCIAVPFFIFLNVSSGGYPWSIFPITGWGIGVAFHAAQVFDWNPLMSKDWEERQIRKMMEDDK
ncbi:MAG: 2TM domain-containing protein [Leeuwenhoekiella sp.]